LIDYADLITLKIQESAWHFTVFAL
jgi:hypothetical protein